MTAPVSLTRSPLLGDQAQNVTVLDTLRRLEARVADLERELAAEQTRSQDLEDALAGARMSCEQEQAAHSTTRVRLSHRDPLDAKVAGASHPLTDDGYRPAGGEAS